MDRFMKLIVISLLVVSLSGCMSLTQTQKNTVYELNSYGVCSNDVKVKDPAVAAWLNVLPGVGHFYLANGSDEPTLWKMAFFNLFTYPLSWFWGIPGAYGDAKVLNQKEQIYFYQYTPEGQAQLSELRKRHNTVGLGVDGMNSNDGRIRVA